MRGRGSILGLFVALVAAGGVALAALAPAPGGTEQPTVGLARAAGPSAHAALRGRAPLRSGVVKLAVVPPVMPAPFFLTAGRFVLSTVAIGAPAVSSDPHAARGPPA